VIDPIRDTTPSLAGQTSRHILVPSFGRFDEITDLVEKTSALTLAASGVPYVNVAFCTPSDRI
jgi:hypothetical protein